MSPVARIECTWISSTVAPRAPGTSDAVASGGGPRPASARAAPIIDAVRSAVPDGASALAAWCSSMISAEGKKRAACSAKRIIKMAPTEKLGTTRTRAPWWSSSQPCTSSSRSSPNPEVPTTTSRSCSTHQRRLSMTAPGWVKSTTASHPVSASRSSPRSTSAATCRSGASPMARITSRPIRPRAPTTPTLIIGLLPISLITVDSYWCHDTSNCPRSLVEGLGLEGGGVVEGADDGQGLGAGEDVGGYRADVVVGDSVDRGEHLVDRLEPRVDQLGLAQAAHPRRRVPQAEHDRAADLTLAAGQLGVGQAAVHHPVDLLAADGQDLVGLGRQAAHVDAPHAGIGVLGREAVHRVGQTALLPDLLEQPGGHSAAER